MTRPASQTARIASDLLDKAHVVCAHSRAADGRKLRLSDLLDSILRPALDRMHEDTLRAVAARQNEKDA